MRWFRLALLLNQNTVEVVLENYSLYSALVSKQVVL